MFGARIIFVALIALFMLYDLVQNLTNYHFRFNIGGKSNIEVYQGKAGSWDVFKRQKYFAETPYGFDDIETDKEPVGEFENLNVELIRRRPLLERISAYWQAGEIEQALGLAKKTIDTDSTGARTRTQSIITLLAGFRSQRVFENIFRPFLEDSNREISIRRDMITALSFSNYSETLPLLISLLKDRNVYVQTDAALALGRSGQLSATEPLLALLQDQDWDVRESATSALGQLGAESAVEPLLALLQEQNSALRSSAARALGQLGAESAVESLVTVLQDQDWAVRSSAARALGQLGAESAVEPLLAVLQDQDWDVRLSAAEALGQLGAESAVEPLLAVLQDQDWAGRSRAAEALGRLGDMSAVEPLLAVLQDQDWDVRSRAARSLGRLGAESAVEPLLAVLQDQDWDVRESAAEALGRLGDMSAVEPLLTVLQDQGSEVRSRAAEALGELGSGMAVESLLAVLQDLDWGVRGSAAQALGKLSAQEAIEPLKAIYSKAEDPKLTVAAALLQFGQEDGFTCLQKRALNPKWQEREELAEVLGNFPSEQGDTLLLSMLEDSHIQVQLQVIRSLGQAQVKSALPTLLKLFSKRSDLRRRKVTIEALAEILAKNTQIPERTLELLQSLVLNQQENFQIRRFAIQGLANFNNEEAITILLKLLQDEHYESYHYYVVKALAQSNSSLVQSSLGKRLEAERKRRAKWRSIRDKTVEPNDEEAYKKWQEDLNEVKPRTSLEFVLAYSLAPLDPNGEGVKLLHHDLAKVREGAWMGLAKLPLTETRPFFLTDGPAAVELIERLDRERMQSKEPLFRHAAYRAIDNMLITIEAYGSAPALKALEDFLPRVQDQEGVLTRVEWTIDRLREMEEWEQEQKANDANNEDNASAARMAKE